MAMFERPRPRLPTKLHKLLMLLTELLEKLNKLLLMPKQLLDKPSFNFEWFDVVLLLYKLLIATQL
jgi:hypothetical protein